MLSPRDRGHSTPERYWLYRLVRFGRTAAVAFSLFVAGRRIVGEDFDPAFSFETIEPGEAAPTATREVISALGGMLIYLLLIYLIKIAIEWALYFIRDRHSFQ